jgi:hypothetical protein
MFFGHSALCATPAVAPNRHVFKKLWVLEFVSTKPKPYKSTNAEVKFQMFLTFPSDRTNVK